MIDTRKINELAIRIDAYEKQKEELCTAYCNTREADSLNQTLYLYGNKKEFRLYMDNDQIEKVVQCLVDEYNLEISRLKDEIIKCLT